MTTTESIERLERPARSTSQSASANILVIDDEEMIRDLLREILVRDGHTVTLSASSSKGLQAFDEGRYDLVYTDLSMPEMSGWEIAAEIKRRDTNAVVVMITGWGVEVDDQKVEESGIEFVISKPFQIPEIRDSVMKALQMKERI
jgi:CheY-like chemotaxis protein